MIIELRKLTNQTVRYTEPIPMSEEFQPADGCRYLEPARVELTLVGNEDEFHLSGSVKAQLELTSHRSLKKYEEEFSETVNVMLIPREKWSEEVELEIAEKEMNAIAYDEELDLRQIINEQIALALPMRLLEPEERDEPELHYSTAPDDKKIDDRLISLQEIKERMMKRGDN